MTVDVRSIHALEQFQHQLDRYRALPGAPIGAIEREAWQTMQVLEQRLNYLQREREHALAAEQQAQRDLERCRAMARAAAAISRDSRSLDCASEEQAYRQAMHRRQMVDEAIEQLRRLIALVNDAVNDARRDSQALLRALDQQGRAAVKHLESSALILRSYAEMGNPGAPIDIDLGVGAIIDTMSDAASTTAHHMRQAAEDTGGAVKDALLGGE
jgi:hypothetical protein